MALPRSLLLALLLPLFSAGCSFHYAKACTFRLWCLTTEAEQVGGDGIIQVATCIEPGDGGVPCTVHFDDCPAPQASGLACERPRWGGIYPTVLTPWTCEGCVDVPALTRQLEYQLAGGVHGLLVLGTLGEGEYASPAGREVVIRTAVTAANGRVPVVAGIHSSHADVALAQMRQARELGASAVLVKFTGCADTDFCEVLCFFQALASAPADTQLPIFVYYYPSQTGLTFSPEQLASLLLLPNVVGSKQSNLDLRHIEKQMNLVAGSGRVFLSGTALNLTQFWQIGGHGAMSPEAALLPCRTVTAYRAAYEAGDLASAREMQKELFVVAPLIQAMPVSEGTARCLTMCSQDHKLPQFTGKEASPAKMKAALNGLGICISPLVAPPQRQLGFCDEVQVNCLLPKLRCLAP